MTHNTKKDPNIAMEDRKCQMSWSSKNDSRMQSLLCSRDSAGVFCARGEKQVIQVSFHMSPNLIGLCVCVWLTCQVLRPWKKKYSAKPHTTAVKRIHTSARHLILSPLRSWAQTENCELQRSQTCLLLSPGASHMRRVTKHTNLHDDIKGKVEQQVTDGDGQQVRGKVVGSLYEAVGSPAER